MASIERGGAWRDLWASGLMGRFMLLCIGVWLHAADTLVTATIVPSVIDDIGGVAYVGWTISLYQVGSVLAGALTAAFCRRGGTRRILTGAALLYGLGCVLAALAPDMAVLLGARLIQGIGGGALVALSYLVIQQSFPEHLWGRLLGIVSVIWGVGSLLGPMIGGVFADFVVWRGVFWCFALQAGVLVAAGFACLPRDAVRRDAPIPLPRLPLVLLMIATLLVAEAGVAKGIALSALEALAGVGLLYGAARLDRRSRSRLFPIRITDWRHPMGAGLFMIFALSVGTTGFWAYGPLLLKTLSGISPLVSGYILAGESLAWSVATMVISGRPLAMGRLFIRSGAVLIVAGAAGFALAVPLGSLPGMVLCALLQGAGFGLCWPAIVHRVVRFGEAGEHDLAMTAPGTVMRVGYGVGAAATGIAANASGLAEGISRAAAQTAGFWVFAGFIPILVLGLVGAWRFTAEEPEATPSESR